MVRRGCGGSRGGCSSGGRSGRSSAQYGYARPPLPTSPALIGDEQEEERLHGLVHVAHALRLNEGMLLVAGAHELGEGRQQALDADAARVHVLPRQQRLVAAAAGGAARCSAYIANKRRCQW
jgi:hypothetical protein